MNQEALLEQHLVLHELIFSGEKVPSYFTRQASGTSSSLTIPLLASFLTQPFFRFRVCAVVICDPMSRLAINGVDIHVKCRFKGRFGNIFKSFGQSHSFWTTQKDSHLFVFDCRFLVNKDNAPLLAEVNYDHVDIQLHISNNALQAELNSTFRLKRWGVRVFEDYSSTVNGVVNPNTLPHVCEADEDNMVYGGCHENETEECGDNFVDYTERCRKRMRTT